MKEKEEKLVLTIAHVCWSWNTFLLFSEDLLSFSKNSDLALPSSCHFPVAIAILVGVGGLARSLRIQYNWCMGLMWTHRSFTRTVKSCKETRAMSKIHTHHLSCYTLTVWWCTLCEHHEDSDSWYRRHHLECHLHHWQWSHRISRWGFFWYLLLSIILINTT